MGCSNSNSAETNENQERPGGAQGGPHERPQGVPHGVPQGGPHGPQGRKGKNDAEIQENSQ